MSEAFEVPAQTTRRTPPVRPPRPVGGVLPEPAASQRAITPATCLAWQAAAGNRAVQRMLQHGAGVDGEGAARQTLGEPVHRQGLRIPVVQRIHFGATQGAAWTRVGPTPLQALLSVQIGGGAQRWPYAMELWDVALAPPGGAATFADRAAAVTAEQTWLATTGNDVLATMLASAVQPQRKGVHGPNRVTDAVYNTANNTYWPFVARLTSTYSAAAGDVNRSVEVQFARDKYGYVIRIDDGGAAYTMAAQGAAPVPGQYASQHGVDATRDLVATSTRLGDETDADDQTKVIAEGGRWQAVAQLAAAGQLFDDSVFYPATKADGTAWQPGDDVPAIEFSHLWTRWNFFNKAWDIPNATLRTELFNNLSQGLTRQYATVTGVARNLGV